jgi:hypothetical protein
MWVKIRASRLYSKIFLGQKSEMKYMTMVDRI